MAKGNHRGAFASDERFLARVATQSATATTNRQKLPAKTLTQPAVQIEASLAGLPAVKTQPSDGKTKKSQSSATKRAMKVMENNKESRFDRMIVDPEAGVLTVILSGAALLSLNFMNRMHNVKATGLKNTWLKRIEALRYENQALFTLWVSSARFPLLVDEVYVTAEGNCLDSESVGAGCKPIIDAFVKNGFLPDDNNCFIAQPLPYTFKGKNSGLVISFRPSPKPWGLVSDEIIDLARSLPSVTN